MSTLLDCLQLAKGEKGKKECWTGEEVNKGDARDLHSANWEIAYLPKHGDG